MTKETRHHLAKVLTIFPFVLAAVIWYLINLGYIILT
jgi:hypothetical protein